MKRDVIIDGSISAQYEDTDENECGTVSIKLVLFITNYSFNINMLVLLLGKCNKLAEA